MIRWGFQFIRRMDALIEEFPSLTQEDVKNFWNEFRTEVEEAYDKSHQWDAFREIIADIVEEETISEEIIDKKITEALENHADKSTIENKKLDHLIAILVEKGVMQRSDIT